MNKEIIFEGFDYHKFMKEEFPQHGGKTPDLNKMVKHFDKITSFLLDCALQAIKRDKVCEDDFDVLHENTRYTIVGNFRLRSINLIKILHELKDIEGNSLFDDATANIIVRSLLESYLVYFQLYNSCEKNIGLQKLYFKMYDLSSLLHFVKFAKEIISENENGSKRFEGRIENLVYEIKADDNFNSLPKKMQQDIIRIKSGKQDYLSFLNFSKLILKSPLPSQFITAFYSYSSSYAHTEGFSSRMSQMIFGSRTKWNKLNELLKLKLIYICLAVSSQFFLSFIEYDETELNDDKKKDTNEVVSLASFYLNAVGKNN